jgi:anaerobic magnesium-protoporphyrin IX monomethyl ester cyclase
MKLTIINPPWFFLDEMNYFPQNLGIRYITSFLNSKGHKADFIDSLNEEIPTIKERVIKDQKIKQIGMNYDSICNLVCRDTDFIGIGIPFTFLNTTAKELTEKLKEKFDVPIITGGTSPSTLPKKALEFSDYIIMGEGEIPLLKLLSGEKPSNIAGFASKKFNNGFSERILNLDELPFPYREENFEKYSSFSARGRKNMKTASIITSRGCPYNCNFCSTHPTSGHDWRNRSVENVLSEIEYLNKKFSISHIEIEDDNFSLNKNKTKKILEEIIKYNERTSIPLTFSNSNGLRIDTLDEEIINLMKKAGFSPLYMALESGNPETLKLMNKKLSLDKVYEIAKISSKYGLSIIYFLMIGYPGETKERFTKSIDFCLKLKELGNSKFTTFLTRPYPGTELFEYCVKKNYVKRSVEEDIFLGSRFDISTPDFDENELRWRLKHANDILNDGKKQDYFL